MLVFSFQRSSNSVEPVFKMSCRGAVRRCGDGCPLTPGLKQAPKLLSPKLQGRSKAWLLAEKSAKSVTGGDSQQWVPCCSNSRAEQLVLKQEKAAEPNQTAPNFSLLSLRRSGGKIFLHPNPSGAGAVGKPPRSPLCSRSCPKPCWTLRLGRGSPAHECRLPG